MTGYPLQAAWELRRREEAAALRVLEEARRTRAAAETRAADRRRMWDDARKAWETARLREPASAREAGDHERFLARLRDEHRRTQAVYEEFERGPLRHAIASEDAAQGRYAEARRAREAIDRHRENFRAEERRAEERRAEETAEEVARAVRHHRDR